MSNVVSIQMVRQQAFWTPKEDISVYELSLAMGVLLLAISGNHGDVEILRMVESLPESTQRHFTINER
jgi:hypothetical protein